VIEVTNIDLKAIISVLFGTFKQIESAYIFGSRRYESGSTRSDIDILLTVSAHLKPSELRSFTMKYCKSLDLFILENGKAVSVANESYITAEDSKALISKLNAELLYDRDNQSSEYLNNLANIKIDERFSDRGMTVMPNGPADGLEANALVKIFERAERNYLPIKPYIGTNLDEASDMLIDVIRRLNDANKSVTGYGQARTGWTNNLSSEYDFQNLFWITVKPWLPNLAREEVAITYDGQDKKSDFSLFSSRLIIEFKYVGDSGDKRETVKTLSGLSDFYRQHKNVGLLLFVIFVDEAVELDDHRWEEDYSYLSQSPTVRTIVVRSKA
jgi:predicted nucleotidyltransferase